MKRVRQSIGLLAAAAAYYSVHEGVVGTERRGDHAGDDKLRRLPDRRGQDALLRIALSDPSVCSKKELGDLWKLL